MLILLLIILLKQLVETLSMRLILDYKRELNYKRSTPLDRSLILYRLIKKADLQSVLKQVKLDYTIKLEVTQTVNIHPLEIKLYI